MKHRILPILVLIMLLAFTCREVRAYLTVESHISWSFKVRPLAYSISDAELIPTGKGWTIVVTFAPIPGPTSVTLQLPGSPAAETEE